MIDLSKFRFRIGDTIEYKGNHYKVMAYYFAEDVNNFNRVYGYTINYPCHTGSDHSFNERGEHICFDENSVCYVTERSVNPVKKSIMTKEEAIKFLSNTRVYTDGRSKEIQKKLFEIGFKWLGNANEVAFLSSPFLFLNSDMSIGHENDMKFFKSHHFKEIKVDDILSITIEEEKPKFKPFDKVLARDSYNDNWHADLFSHYNVGNSNYPFRTLVSYYKYCIPYEGNEHLVGTNKLP